MGWASRANQISQDYKAGKIGKIKKAAKPQSDPEGFGVKLARMPTRAEVMAHYLGAKGGDRNAPTEGRK